MKIKQSRLAFRFKIYMYGIFLVAVFIALLYFRNSTFKHNRIQGWLHTRGTKIFDSQNKEIVITGINYNELTPINFVYRQPDLKDLPDVCKLWNHAPSKLNATDVSIMGFNAVRLVLNWDILEPSAPIIENGRIWKHNWNMDYVLAIDKTISDLKKEKIAVILDMHQYLWSSVFKYIISEDGQGCAGGGIPGWLYPEVKNLTFQQARCDFFKNIKYPNQPINPQDGFLEAWKFLIDRYKDNDSVIAADIINEPWMAKGFCSSKELNLNKFYEKFSHDLHEINPNLLLILEDGQDFAETDRALQKPLITNNILYSLHLYTGNWLTDGLNITENFIKRAKDWEVPLYIGEFDGFGWSNNLIKIDENKTAPELRLMMDYLKNRQINWTFWSYSGMYSIMEPTSKKVKNSLLKILQTGF